MSYKFRGLHSFDLVSLNGQATMRQNISPEVSLLPIQTSQSQNQMGIV